MRHAAAMRALLGALAISAQGALGLSHAAGDMRPALEAVIAKALDGTLPPSLFVRKVQLISLVKLSDAALYATVDWTQPPAAGQKTVHVSFWNDGAEVGSTWAALALAPRVHVAVAKHALPVGTLLTDRDMTVEWRDPNTVKNPAVPSDLRGARVVRDLAAGEMLVLHDVETVPPMPRGTALTVILRAGSIEVSSTGTLEKPARPGDSVPVRVSTGKVVVAEIIDGQTAHVRSAR